MFEAFYWQQRFLNLMTKRAAIDLPVKASFIAAEDLRLGDVFEFVGEEWIVQGIDTHDLLVNVRVKKTITRTRNTTVKYLPFETVKVRVPRPELET